MTKSTSVFLDFLRVVAALTVFDGHLRLKWHWTGDSPLGHDAVIIFFVLSGYVITFATLQRETTFRRYTVARLARLYSVVIPALILTAFVILAVHTFAPAADDLGPEKFEPLRFLASATYLQSIWSHNLVPQANGPLWSLGYEFWYYAMFAALVFARGWKMKAAGFLACCLVVGLNVLLLLPIWALGVGLYLSRDRCPLPRPLAIVGFCTAVVVTALLVWRLPSWPDAVGQAPLFYSGSFLTDWLLGLAVGAMIWFYSRTWRDLPVPESIERPVRWAAGHTFSLYLFHFPLIVFASALGIFSPSIWWSAALEVALILAVIIALGELTESKRRFWQRGFDAAWGWATRAT
jgi:peptidoglycan/LPS O-acetylase OafA/YrhL